MLNERIKALQQWIADLETELQNTQLTVDPRYLEQVFSSIQRLMDALEALFDQVRRDQQPSA